MTPTYKEGIDQLPVLHKHPLARRAVPADVLSGLLQMWDESDALLTKAESATKGVCHLDCHDKNLFPMEDVTNGRYTVAVDWARVGIDCYGMDSASLLASAVKWLEMSPENAAALVDPLLDAYVAGLTAAGWSGDEEQVRLVYLTRFGCEARRILNIITQAHQHPQVQVRLASLFRTPIEEIYNQWAEVQRFFLRCHAEAVDIARL